MMIMSAYEDKALTDLEDRWWLEEFRHESNQVQESIEFQELVDESEINSPEWLDRMNTYYEGVYDENLRELGYREGKVGAIRLG